MERETQIREWSRTYSVVDVEDVGIVSVDCGDGVESNQRVFDVRWLVLGSDVRRTLSHPRATLHA